MIAHGIIRNGSQPSGRVREPLVSQKRRFDFQSSKGDKEPRLNPSKRSEALTLPFEVLGRTCQQLHRKRSHLAYKTAPPSEAHLVDDLGSHPKDAPG